MSAHPSSSQIPQCPTTVAYDATHGAGVRLLLPAFFNVTRRFEKATNGRFRPATNPPSILFAASPNVFPLWDLWQKECDANTQMGGMVKAPLCGRM